MKIEHKKVIEVIDDKKLDEIKFLQELIRAPSTIGQEESAQDPILQKFTELNLKVDMWEPSVEDLCKIFPGYIPYIPEERTEENIYTNRNNLVGILKGVGGGKSIILNGHVDVAPPGRRELWRHNFWSGLIENDKIYGRGACDMKGGIAAMAYAVGALKESGMRLKGDVIVESVIDEEGGNAGTCACIARGYRADAAVVTEPTNLEIQIAQGGLLRFQIIVKGKPAHAAMKYEGVSALEKAMRIYNVLMDLEAYRRSVKRHALFERYQNQIPLNVGLLKSGRLYSMVPDEATMEGRVGLLPGETFEQVKEQLEEYVRTAAKLDPWLKDHLPEVEWGMVGAGALPSYEIPIDHPFVQTFEETFKEATGADALISAMPAGCDASLLGIYGNTPCALFGPGEGLRHAHSPNESVKIDDVITATKVLALTILNWCEYES